MFRYEEDHHEREELSADAVATVLGSVVGTFAVVSMGWLTVLGFAGGAVPLIGVQLPGGFLYGLLWMLVLGSAGVAVLWVLPLLASMVLYRAVARVSVPGRLTHLRHVGVRSHRDAA